MFYLSIASRFARAGFFIEGRFPTVVQHRYCHHVNRALINFNSNSLNPLGRIYNGHDFMHILKKKEKIPFLHYPYHSLVELCPNCARQGQIFPNSFK